jgi:hypothetical protein
VNAFACVYEANETRKNLSSFLLIRTILEVTWEVCLAEQHADEYIETQAERNNRFVKNISRNLTMFTQPPTEMSAKSRRFWGVECGRHLRLTN